MIKRIQNPFTPTQQRIFNEIKDVAIDGEVKNYDLSLWNARTLRSLVNHDLIILSDDSITIKQVVGEIEGVSETGPEYLKSQFIKLINELKNSLFFNCKLLASSKSKIEEHDRTAILFESHNDIPDDSLYVNSLTGESLELTHSGHSINLTLGKIDFDYKNEIGENESEIVTTLCKLADKYSLSINLSLLPQVTESEHERATEFYRNLSFHPGQGASEGFISMHRELQPIIQY